MKSTQADIEARERMAPGRITAGGFLGNDQRALGDIVEADLEELSRLGVDPDAAADALERLRDAAQTGLGEPVTVGGRWLVSSGDARGMLACPWHDGLFHKNSIVVRGMDGRELAAYSDLSIHLLRVHRFLQGRGSPFRLEPRILAELAAQDTQADGR